MLHVTVNPVDAKGRRYSISLEKTAADRGYIRIDPEGPADVTVIKLYDLRTTGPAAIVCWGDVPGPDVTVACRLLAGEGSAPPRLQVEIRGSLFGVYDGTSDYGVTPQELDRARTFLRDAAFPPARATV